MNAGSGIVQIVPTLGLSLDGVADYATALAPSLASSAGIHSSFLCGDPRVAVDRIAIGAPVTALRSRSVGALVEALHGQTPEAGSARQVVLLHYANYGYEARGCPVWLVRGIEEWKRRVPEAWLVTMFHELFASGPPWRSSFWLSPLQRYLARELFRVSDASVTNREQSRQWLLGAGERMGPQISVMPVFSSLGEPVRLTDWKERSGRMVVAGRSGALHRAYGRFREQLIHACRHLGIDEIVDLGARSSRVPDQVGGIPIVAIGHLAPSQVSTILGEARAGFLDYPSDYLGKSTVFAAYAAHGLVPVVSWRRGEEEAGLLEGANYWVPDSDRSPPRDFASIARQARAWYADHRLEMQARAYATLLRRASA